MEKGINENNKKQKNKKILIIIVLCILIILIIISRFAYAKYITTKQSSATAKIATMICELEVEASQPDKTIINPYCIVKVKNYNSEDKITETDLNFKIEVTPKGDFVLPEYYWKDTSGTILAQSTEVTGSMTHNAKETKEYTIVFLNSGEADIVRNVDFNVVAIQVGE